jgi:phospholipid/cholesterol/gamma-HCH transport system substrate-binding protein
MRSFFSAAGRRLFMLRGSTIAGVTALCLAAAGIGAFLTSSPGTYPISAVFQSAQGVFPGNAVRLLGVQIGTVTNVQYTHGAVRVDMQVSGDQPLPAKARAALISPLILGQPDVELSPGYTGGPSMRAGTTIPESRTAVPVSTDELLKQLQRVLGAVKPTSLHDLVGNLSNDLSGQGAQLHQLITSASGTLQLLAEKGRQLGQLNGNLAQLTGTLRANEGQLLNLVDEYETVSSVIAGHEQALGASINDLSKASARLAGLLSPNLKPLEQDLAVITTTGRTLDRNLGNLDQVMSSSRSLFAAAKRSYDPRYQWLNLNNQLAPGLTVDQLEGMIRDRLAGICRRVLAHHSAGLSAKEKQTLAKCGNQYSGYFNGVLSLIPGILSKGGLTNPGGNPPSAPSLLSPGLAKIPGLSKTERHKIASSSLPATSTGGSQKKTKKSSKKASPAKDCSGLNNSINCILGPLPALGSTSGQGGSGGLLGADLGTNTWFSQLFGGW